MPHDTVDVLEISSLAAGDDVAAYGARSASEAPSPLVREIGRLRAELAAATKRADNLDIALRSSRRIGAALGILMNQRHVTMDEAFELLRVTSQQAHRKLRDVAEDVLYTGALDTSAPADPDRTRS